MLGVAAPKDPPLSIVRAIDTHRLIPSRYEDTVLAKLAESEDDLAALFEIDAATNDRMLAEAGRSPGIGIDELVFGIPYHRIVNAAYTHPHPLGGRFNSPDRGAWYAGLELDTAIAEVAHHHTVTLSEIGYFEDVVRYRDYLADIGAELHDLRNDPDFAACLDPNSYVDSQCLADRLLHVGAVGVIYPSARHKRGTCIACFRPAVVSHVREGDMFTLTWNGSPQHAVEHGA